MSSKNVSITCLLGVSTLASTVIHVMLSVLDKEFPELLNSEKGKALFIDIAPTSNIEINIK
ncbi:MAG: L-2-hydroxyglutarate oxidase LhgO [Psychroserpens sp.]|uniref:malate:quinone oxidoreductase n=1 Tax=Psychroserpens sp. TaxID=2020870 RepID=UPI0039E67316